MSSVRSGRRMLLLAASLFALVLLALPGIMPAAFGFITPAIDNFAGYGIQTNGAGTFTQVSGNFLIPTLTCTSATQGQIVYVVSIGGTGIDSGGVELGCFGTVAYYVPWCFISVTAGCVSMPLKDR